MPEVDREVKVFKKEYLCDECETGYMRPTGICLTSNPPLYPHKCTLCGFEKRIIGKKYPTISYR